MNSMRVSFTPFNVADLDEQDSTIYALDRELNIVFVNSAWSRFAAANGARWDEHQFGLGTPIMSVVPTILKFFFERLFEQALAGAVVEHDYECSSATVARSCRMTLYPMRSGVLVVHSMLNASKMAPHLPPLESTYRDSRTGFIVQCCHCRRIQRVAQPNSWDWVPEYVEQSKPQTSHGLCRICFHYYYSDWHAYSSI